MTGGPLLAVDGLTVSFGAIRALADVTVTVDPAERVGLIGPNGAGKTTLFDCLTGHRRPQRGRIRFAGHDLGRTSTHGRARAGIGRTFQRLEPFTGLSVRDHLLVAARARVARGTVLRDLAGRGTATPAELGAADEVLELLGLERDADRPVESLGLARGRLVELGRALVSRPCLLLLDEPGSGLDVAEAAHLGDVLVQVSEERRTAVLLVEHDVSLVKRVAQRVICLDRGSVIADGPPRAVLDDDAVRRAYLGEDPAAPR